ncbi:uncharacterized protein LOC106865512 [Brachypodium distachyon]|uniref:uncharacterized protein LOC106865512 n=1 Tax=Brachypodium distachyon TaxID=15368 RepID=UPI00071D19A3|nr:uncharacterized protein LOC106865512 [Brachypodium distachyon]|eukprot:XP_014751138.1 uncharacterized protein LOC106865512 [Brachypodium distachyon]
MSIHNVNLLCWNVRGLNNPARRSAVRDIIRDTHATVVCIQETKLQLVAGRLIRDILGPKFCNNFATLPAAGTRGGMIMAVSDDFFVLSGIHFTTHSITATVTMRSEGIPWSLTLVYGPQSDAEKLLFIDELRLLEPVVKAEWVLLGDFNIITKAADKNNTNINRRLIGKFLGPLNFLQLKEISLGGRCFTWSNEQENPVLTKIDHIFCTDDWDVLFPNALLQAVPTFCSDHAPLFLQGEPTRWHRPSFKFEQFWLQMPGFQDTVAGAWNKHVVAQDALRRIHIKLNRAAKALKKWQKERFGFLDYQLAIIKEVIWRIDIAEEERPLSMEEWGLRRHLKNNYLGHLSVQKVKLRQRSSLAWIKTGDANTKLFHIRVNDRRRKNFIQHLQTP